MATAPWRSRRRKLRKVEWGNPPERIIALQHNEVNIFGAWRLAALGSGDFPGYTGYLSVRRQKAYGNRRLLRWIAGETLPYVGWIQRLATLHTGGLGRVLLRQGLFLLLFFRGERRLRTTRVDVGIDPYNIGLGSVCEMPTPPSRQSRDTFQWWEA